VRVPDALRFSDASLPHRTWRACSSLRRTTRPRQGRCNTARRRPMALLRTRRVTGVVNIDAATDAVGTLPQMSRTTRLRALRRRGMSLAPTLRSPSRCRGRRVGRCLLYAPSTSPKALREKSLSYDVTASLSRCSAPGRSSSQTRWSQRWRIVFS
jgi:hypothetical protein